MGSKFTDPPILAMGWAILAAGVLQLLFLMPALAKLDLLALPRWGWRYPDVRRVMVMVPTLLGSSVAQVNLLFDTFIAAMLVHGSQSWLSTADRFLEFPLGVFGIALGTVILPTLSPPRQHRPRGFSEVAGLGPARDPDHHPAGDAGPDAAGAAAGEHDLPVRQVHGRGRPHDRAVGVRPQLRPARVRAGEDGVAGVLRAPGHPDAGAGGLASMVANMVFNIALLALLVALWVPEEARQEG